MEYAFFATETGLVCKGDPQAASALMAKSASQWVRAGQRQTERRLLASILASPESAARAARCR